MNQCTIIETTNGWFVKAIHTILDEEDTLRVFEIPQNQPDAQYATFAEMIKYVSEMLESGLVFSGSKEQKLIKFSYEVVDKLDEQTV